MNGKELMKTLYAWSPLNVAKSNDGLVYGNEEREIKKLAVCCIATIDVIKDALKWGADTILTHEPTFHDYFKVDETNEVYKRKLALFNDNNLSIFRFHDNSHFTPTDRIIEGVLRETEWKGTFDGTKKFTFDTPMTAKEVYAELSEKLQLSNIRFIGNGNEEIKSISMCVGSWGPDIVFNELCKEDIDAAVVGENCEWNLGEYCRDAVQLGIGKPLFILGHMGSEKDGMKFIADYLKNAITDMEIQYFDCGELFTKI